MTFGPGQRTLKGLDERQLRLEVCLGEIRGYGAKNLRIARV
jgi:hypothetical protein